MPHTDSVAPPAFLSYRHRLLLGLSALAALLLATLAAGSILSLALGWRLMAAGFGLLTVLASPLLLLGLAQDWWRHRRGHRRRHLIRPEGFGR